MENDDIAGILKLTGQLLELHGANSFKSNAYIQAAFRIDRHSEPVLDMIKTNSLGKIEGLGSSMSAALKEISETGTLTQLEKMISETPEGVLELLKIKGLGPKKVSLIWKEYDITSPGELLYACNENRLVEIKGFGAKTQESIRKSIEYKISNAGKLLFARATEAVAPVLEFLHKQAYTRCELSGEMRRMSNVISQAEILLEGSDFRALQQQIESSGCLHAIQETAPNCLQGKTEEGFLIQIELVTQDFEKRLFFTTGNEKHIEETGITPAHSFNSETEAYQLCGLPWIPPELREGKGEIEEIRKNGLPDLVEYDNLKGILHVHTTWSDGQHSLEEMAMEARTLGFQYLGITDHSKSAFYANGLSEERILAQHQEIDLLNTRLAPFKIFKGIEADILNDGNLDYAPEILRTFDFVIASVHSNLRMNEEKAMKRLMAAIENPFTTMLGHPTGRLLLAREAYPLDHKVLIDACARHNVIIELNANPYRLDMDWEWIPYAMEKGVKISINPDAHRKQGYEDMHWGIASAKKGRLNAAFTFNALDVSSVQACFENKKRKALSML